MRLGGPVFKEYGDGDQWAAAVRELGYSAAYAPVLEGDDKTAAMYAKAAAKNNIVIAEVGAWSNPLSPDDKQRSEAIALCKQRLDLADRLGARCCVNITGSRGPKWDGPDARDFTDETFDMIVQVTREIVDDVAPTRTYYTLETMPWMYPDSPDSYMRLIDAIDRERVAVHLDPVNLICSPQRYFNNAAVIRECFAKLGSKIRSCHGKDITLSGNLTVHLDETVPGRGGLDYGVFLTELAKLADNDTPLMLEHLSGPESYDEAAAHIRKTAVKVGVKIL